MAKSLVSHQTLEQLKAAVVMYDKYECINDWDDIAHLLTHLVLCTAFAAD
jgi:hypothetical protein